MNVLTHYEILCLSNDVPTLLFSRRQDTSGQKDSGLVVFHWLLFGSLASPERFSTN